MSGVGVQGEDPGPDEGGGEAVTMRLGIRPAIRFARRVQLRKVTKGMPHEVARDF